MWTTLGLKPGFRDYKPATDHLNTALPNYLVGDSDKYILRYFEGMYSDVIVKQFCSQSVSQSVSQQISQVSYLASHSFESSGSSIIPLAITVLDQSANLLTCKLAAGPDVCVLQ
jgi:hypothetical protein